MDSKAKHYQDKAKGILRAEIRRRNLNYDHLAEKLETIGVKESSRNLSNKISRGAFTAGFFIQCLEAIGCHSVRLDEG
jgi:hypothetical protein